MRFPIVAVFVALGLAHGPATAQPSQYRWVDAAGVVHYSNFPPPTSTALAPVPPPPSPPKAQPSPRTVVAAPTATTVLAPAIRIVKASGEYQMGDRDTREEAVRLATEAARKNALEQVATYLERVTMVTDAMVSRDEIRTYTAGVILVIDQKTSTRLDGDTVVVHVDLTAQVDPDEVVQAIKALRQNDQAAAQIAALRTEVDRLQDEVDAANRALASATAPDQARAISQQRQDLLNRIDSNAALAQAWTDWVIITPFVAGPRVALPQVQGLLAQARSLSPNNPNLSAAQRFIVNQPVAAPPTRSMPPSAPSVTQAPAPRISPPVVPQAPAPHVAYAPAPRISPPVVSQAPAPHVAYAPAPRISPPVVSQAPAPHVAYAPPSKPLPPTLYQIHPWQQRAVPRMPYRRPPPSANSSSPNQQSSGAHPPQRSVPSRPGS